VNATVTKLVTVRSPLPLIPPPGTIVSNVQEDSGWLTCGGCGNDKKHSQEATYSMTRGLTTPAIDNKSTSAEFSIGGPYSYTDAYWHHPNTAIKTPVKKLVYDFYLYVPAASAKAPQGIEFECQQSVNGYTYNYAWQADYGSHKWRTFDYINKVWVATTIPFVAFTPDTWHHIVAEYHADGTNAVHDALTVDGVRILVNRSNPALHTGSKGESMSNAFQLDLNSVPTAYSVYVDKMTVTYE